MGVYAHTSTYIIAQLCSSVALSSRELNEAKRCIATQETDHNIL